jgi:hypothetical protein
VGNLWRLLMHDHGRHPDLEDKPTSYAGQEQDQKARDRDRNLSFSHDQRSFISPGLVVKNSYWYDDRSSDGVSACVRTSLQIVQNVSGNSTGKHSCTT